MIPLLIIALVFIGLTAVAVGLLAYGITQAARSILKEELK